MNSNKDPQNSFFYTNFPPFTHSHMQTQTINLRSRIKVFACKVSYHLLPFLVSFLIVAFIVDGEKAEKEETRKSTRWSEGRFMYFERANRRQNKSGKKRLEKFASTTKSVEFMRKAWNLSE